MTVHLPIAQIPSTQPDTQGRCDVLRGDVTLRMCAARHVRRTTGMAAHPSCAMCAIGAKASRALDTRADPRAAHGPALTVKHRRAVPVRTTCITPGCTRLSAATHSKTHAADIGTCVACRNKHHKARSLARTEARGRT